jgi:hypothetical protein
VAEPRTQTPEEYLRVFRQIGLSALSAIDHDRKAVREGMGERTLEAIAQANADSLGDEAIEATLQSDSDTYTKLVEVAEFASVIAAQIEATLLPQGWAVRETTSGRFYSYQGGNAQVTITKIADRGSMTIRVFGATTWSGYVGESAGYVPLTDALKRAEETLADPSSHLSPYGVAQVEAAKNRQDADRAEAVAVLRQTAKEWTETADRYKNALLGERFIVLDRFERAFTRVQVDGESRFKLELPASSLNGVSFMTKEDADKACEHLNSSIADDSAAPFAVWDFEDYARRQAAKSVELANKAAEAKWSAGREARSLGEAKELAEVAITRLGLPQPKAWRESVGSLSQWEYAAVDVGGYKDLSVGASSGGVVAMDGYPFTPTPGDRKMNVTLTSVEMSMQAAVAALRRGVTADAQQTDSKEKTMDKKSIEETLPAAWASSLVSGDYSGLEFDDPEEANRCREWVQENQLRAVSASEPYFGTYLGKATQVADFSCVPLPSATSELPSMSGEQKEFVDRLSRDTGLSGNNAALIAEKLGELAAKHFRLAYMDVRDGLTASQKAGQEAIEREISAGVKNLPGIKEAVFVYDPRGTTVGLKFESGAYNSFNGSWKVPLADGAVKRLPAEFWSVPAKPSVWVNDAHAAGSPWRVYQGESEPTIVGQWRPINNLVDLAAEVSGLASKPELLPAGPGPGAANETDGPSGYVVLSIHNTDNAAFVDVGRDQEVSRIIGEAAETIEAKTGIRVVDFSLREVEFSLRDINGNKVGDVRYTAAVPAGEPDIGAVRLAVKVDNAAFVEDGTNEVGRILREAASKVRNGENNFTLRDINGNAVGKFEFREEPTLDKGGVIDLDEALESGRVYLAEDGFSGIADGAFRYVVTTPDFEPGYGQGEGDVWLVNAKGEIASGYEEPQSVREVLFRELKRDEKVELRAVVEGRVAFDDFERRFSDEEPGLGD